MPPKQLPALSGCATCKRHQLLPLRRLPTRLLRRAPSPSNLSLGIRFHLQGVYAPFKTDTDQRVSDSLSLNSTASEIQ